MIAARAGLVVALALAATGCPDLGAPLQVADAASTDAPRPRDAGAVEHLVFMQALAFCDEVDCGDVSRINAGDTITWVNNDTAFHEIVYGDPDAPGTELFHSPAIQVGQSWSYTFETPGDFEYYCANHSRLMNMAHILVGGGP